LLKAKELLRKSGSSTRDCPRYFDKARPILWT
jgi:hypothetical protein